ncbi:MAG TPA: PEP-CTERM system TPR-repeat protein PrsT [Alphaproteobacteria bacterium]|nr:PEP-CTERM system TPR-repeat protein PrsT [Alphaproteobacteria bacterium]
MLKPKSEHSLTKISGRAMYPVSSDDGRNSANGAKIRKRAGKSGFTRRFLGGSLAVLLAASAGSWSQTVYAANSESEEYFQDAKKALKEGKTNEGVIHLKNAVRADPDNVEARFLLGQYNIQRGDFAGAEKEFREARKRGMEGERILLPLAQVYLRQGKADDLLAEIDAEKFEGKARALAHALRARAFILKNDLKKAGEALDLARPDSDESAIFYITEAELLQRKGDLTAAEQAIDTALSIDPKSPQALGAKGELRRVQQDLPGALESYNAALAQDKNNIQIHLSRAFTLLALKRTEEAEADVDLILKRMPEIPMALYLKSALLAQRGETEKALEAIQPVEFRLASFMPAVYLLANLNLKLNRLEGAVSYAERYHAANEDRPDAVKLLASIYLRQKRVPDALKILKPHEEKEEFTSDQLYLQLLGNSYLGAREYSSASSVFKALQKLNPENQTVREQLAITSLGMGEQDSAISELEELTAEEGGSDRANMLLILTHLRSKEYDKAETAARNFVRNNEQNATAQNLLGSVLLSQDKRDEARASFERALQVNPEFVPSVINLSLIERMENKPAEAKKRLEKFLETDKGNEKVLLGLADLAVAQDNSDEALTWLEKAVAENPKSETPRLKMIGLQMQLKKSEAALQTAMELSGLAPDSPVAVSALAQTQILNKQLANGVATLRRLVILLPKSPKPQMMLGEAQMLNNNLPEAKAAFDEAVRLAPDLAEAKAGRINVELKDAGSEAAISLAEKYRNEAPDNPDNSLLLGNLYLRNQQYAQAVEALEKAQQLRPNGATFRSLYGAMIKADKEKEAFAQLQQWAKENPDDWESRMVLSTEYIRYGNMQKAIAETEALNEKFPGRPLILNNLGWLYARNNDPRGKELVRTALEIAPDVAEIQDTYGWILVKEGKVSEGLEPLRKAAAALPAVAEVQYHFAAALAQSGKKSEAVDVLTKILAGNDSFEERKDAEALLQSLKSG